jgi:hypothetical protein
VVAEEVDEVLEAAVAAGVVLVSVDGDEAGVVAVGDALGVEDLSAARLSFL